MKFFDSRRKQPTPQVRAARLEKFKLFLADNKQPFWVEDAQGISIVQLRADIAKSPNSALYWKDYWTECINSPLGRNKSFCADKVVDKILRCYLEHLAYYGKEGESLNNFMEGKRPLGNKEIAASVIYTCGIDMMGGRRVACNLPKNAVGWAKDVMNIAKGKILNEDFYDYDKLIKIMKGAV